MGPGRRWAILIFMKPVDGHTHIFPPDFIRERQNLAGKDTHFGLLYANPTAKMADAPTLLASMEKEGVERSVVCGFSFQDHGLVKENNDYILEAARSDERLIPFVAIDGNNKRNALREIERTVSFGARGIGEIAFYSTGLHRREAQRLDHVFAATRSLDLPVMIHLNEEAGHEYHGKTSADFRKVGELISKHPSQKIILAHLGGGICFYEFMPEIRQAFANTFYDTAATPFVYDNTIYRFVEVFLAEKTLFGSDFPLLTPRRYEEGLRLLSESAREKILSTNIRRLLRVS